MKILILSFYFPPDLSAGSFRTKSLTDALIRSTDDELEIEVITTLPNRYSNTNYSSNEETIFNKKIKVKRIEIFKHKNGFIDQSLSFLSYFTEVIKYSKHNEWDIIYATSSRLMTAFLGAIISKKKKTPLYLDIRDIFTDVLKDLYPLKVGYIVRPFFLMIEKFTYKNACQINIVSRGFQKHVVKLSKEKKISNHTNGIDEKFFTKEIVLTKDKINYPIKILYAGNIGLGQGLENIVPEIAIQLNKEIEFTIIGGGNRTKILQDIIIKKNINNVKIQNPISQEKLFKKYNDFDILFLHLNNFSAYEKVIPSKIFEYAATGKPILAGVKGYARQFIENEIEGAYIFRPNDHEELLKKIKSIKLNNSIYDRSDFFHKFKRNSIMDNMSKDILKLYQKI
jgi:glycosyltransferase involved in cell wall biosynthesis